VQVHALLVLAVHLIGDGNRDAAQFVARRIQHLAAEIEQSADFASGHAA
jgi:hypothetical protein